MMVGRVKLALADEDDPSLLAPPLIDLIGRCPSLASRAISASTGRSSRASRASVLTNGDE
jgi:hypothetical protein